MKFLSASLMVLSFSACGAPNRMHSSSDREQGPRRVERDYGKPAADVWRAAVTALEAMDLMLDDDRRDPPGGRIVARRASGDRLTVDVVSLDEHRSKVVVELDPGTGNLATMVQDKLTEQLGLSKAKTSRFGGNSVTGKYSCTLSRGVRAAEQVIRRLSLELLSIDVREQEASVDARDEASIPIRFLFTRVNNETIKAQFTVGATPSVAARTTAKRLKSEFERDLVPPVEQ